MFYVILVIYGIYCSALQGTRPIISLFANAQGASPFIIGLLVSCFALLPMLLAVTIGKWLDRYGARYMIIMGSSGLFFSLLMPILFPNVISLFFTQLLAGFSQPFILLSFQKTVGNLPGNRDKLIATFALTGAFGELIGPLFAGFTYEHFGFQVTMGVCFLGILLALLCGLMVKKSVWKSGTSAVKDKNQVAESPWKMLKQRDLRKALIISGLVLFSRDFYVAFFPVYANNIGLAAGTIGIILSIKGALSMVVRLCQFYLVSKFGRGLVLTTTLIISGMSFILIPGTANIIFLAVLSGLLGIGLGLGQPLSLVYALDLTPPESHGGALGLRITFNRLSQFVAPFLLGGIGGIAGVVPVFWFSGGILFFSSYFTHIKPRPIPELADSTLPLSNNRHK